MFSSSSRVIATFFLVVTPAFGVAAQSSVAVSPFISYIPSATTNPLAGFALTFGGTTGLAFRSGAEISISNPRVDSASAPGYRPWGADADALLYLGGLGGGATVFQRALSPYLFSGIGLTGGDSAGRNVVRHGWSYGAGATLPLGLDADLFAEARWRMSEYVLPTAKDAPDSKSALRFGLSFMVGGGSPPAARPRRGRGQRMAAEDYQDEEPVQYVEVQPAPAPPPQVVVVQAPAPQPVVIMQPAPQPVVVQSGPVIAPTVVIQRDSHRPRRRARHVRPAPVVVVPRAAPVVVPRRAPVVVRPVQRTTAPLMKRVLKPAAKDRRAERRPD